MIGAAAFEVVEGEVTVGKWYVAVDLEVVAAPSDFPGCEVAAFGKGRAVFGLEFLEAAVVKVEAFAQAVTALAIYGFRGIS